MSLIIPLSYPSPDEVATAREELVVAEFPPRESEQVPDDPPTIAPNSTPYNTQPGDSDANGFTTFLGGLLSTVTDAAAVAVGGAVNSVLNPAPAPQPKPAPTATGSPALPAGLLLIVGLVLAAFFFLRRK